LPCLGGFTARGTFLKTRVKGGTRAHLRTQRRGPSAVVDFSCKAALSRGAEVGAMRADMDPRLRAAPSRDSWRRRLCPWQGSTSPKGQKCQPRPLSMARTPHSSQMIPTGSRRCSVSTWKLEDRPLVLDHSKRLFSLLLTRRVPPKVQRARTLSGPPSFAPDVCTVVTRTGSASTTRRFGHLVGTS